MNRYYYISKLDEKKALKLLYDEQKEKIIFRDYEHILIKIDHEKYAHLLEIIGTEQSKVAATWLRLYKKYGKEACFGAIRSNPIINEFINNSKVYVEKYKVLLKYNDVAIAEIPLDFASIGVNASELQELELINKSKSFQSAIDSLIEYKQQKLKEAKVYNSYAVGSNDWNDKYDIKIDLLDFSNHTVVNKTIKVDNVATANNNISPATIKTFKIPQKKLLLKDLIKELDIEKLINELYSIDTNETIKLSVTIDMIKFLDQAITQMDLTKVKNKYLRRLIRFRQKFDIYVSLLLVDRFMPGFSVYINSNYEESLPLNVLKIKAKLDIKNEIKRLKQIKLYGIEASGFKINPDGTVEITNYSSALKYFDTSFVIRRNYEIRNKFTIK
jgi:hypothetical protein